MNDESGAKPTEYLSLRQYVIYSLTSSFTISITMNSSVDPVVDKVNPYGSNDPGQRRVPGKVEEAIIFMDINISSTNVAEC